MRRIPVPILLSLAGLSLATLACQTVMAWPSLLSGRATPVAVPLPAVTAAPVTPGEADPGPLVSSGGPTLGTARETRVALAAGAPGVEDLAAETYTSDEVNQVGARLTYTIALEGAETQLLWGYGWCATTRAILDQNMEQLRVDFLVNGQSVDQTQFDVVDSQSSDGLECHSARVVVYDWPSGVTTLETRITFLEAINDGMGDYPAGDQVFTYVVTAP